MPPFYGDSLPLPQTSVLQPNSSSFSETKRVREPARKKEKAGERRSGEKNLSTSISYPKARVSPRYQLL